MPKKIFFLELHISIPFYRSTVLSPNIKLLRPWVEALGQKHYCTVGSLGGLRIISDSICDSKSLCGYEVTQDDVEIELDDTT